MAVADYPRVMVRGALAALQSGRRPHGGSRPGEHGIPSLGGENLRQDGVLFLTDVRKIPAAFFSRMSAGVLRTGDVLINKDGAQTGKVATYDGEFPAAAINEHLFLLRADPAIVTSRFLFWALFWEVTQRQIAHVITGSAQPGLGQGFVDKVLIPLPPIPDQTRIAEILDTVEDAIRGTQRIIKKLHLVKRGLLCELFTSSVTEQGQHSRCDSALRRYSSREEVLVSQGWSTVTVDEAADPTAPICYGIVQAGGYVENGPQVLTIRDLSGDFREGLHRTSPDIDALYARSRVQPEDILVSIKGTVGRVAVVPSWYSGNISRDLGRIRLRDLMFPEFVKQYFLSPAGQAQLGRAVVGTTRAEISIFELKRIILPRPHFQEQRRIAERLASADQAIETECAALKKLQLLKQGLVSDLISGRSRVSGLKAGLPA